MKTNGGFLVTKIKQLGDRIFEKILSEKNIDAVSYTHLMTPKAWVRLSIPMRIFSTIPDLPPLPKIKRTIPAKAWISVTINM